ncbi:MAG: S-methyl-5-thioribose kinase [Clostridia bacterium]|nr:S-methyl-5-thioribose kinase [Clostridia bacterium]
MNAEIEAYLKSCFFSSDDELRFDEITGGNINHIYRVRSKLTGKTLILKQARREAVISREMKLEVCRGRREAGYIKLCGSFLPGSLPELYGYNRRLRLLVMQDMSPGYEMLRSALLAGRSFDFLPSFLADFVAATTVGTSDFALEPKKKKALVKSFTNPDLCALTERLVFTEPFVGSPENSVSAENESFCRERILSNKTLRAAAAGLKYDFMNKPQALIHGDLHFGSIFVSDSGAVVFDPEFCFFGPIGFDSGNVFAHFVMEYIYASVSGNKKLAEEMRRGAGEFISAFEERLSAMLAEQRTDAVLCSPDFTKRFVASVISDTAGFAGVECLRRTVGIAKIPEFGMLCPSARSEMERRVIEAGISLIEAYGTSAPAADVLKAL